MTVRLVSTAILMMLATAATAAPTVSGNTISWPDDGWYQVQADNEDGIFEVCAGGFECEVPNGNYIVINHTTGERFTGIEVPQTSTDTVTVSGNTISWPDDGWYQVQTSDGATNICEGTRSCQVEPGSYIVINHSTGQRFTNVMVSDAPTSQVISIDGNTISWPDDGWYQVQSADTFESFCQGGFSCTVDDGTYIVINHTTGERFTDITVSGGSSVEEPPIQASFNLLDISQDLIVTAAGFQLDQLAVVVDDLAFIIGQETTIQWPDSSYYQVQDAETYASVCNGGAECKILPGSYTLINHTTGERSPLVVPYVSPADQPDATQLAETSVTFPLPQDPAIISTALTIERTYYSCENGGSLILERGNKDESAFDEGSFYDSFGSLVGGVQDINGYVFDQCGMTLRNGLLPDSSYVLNGNLQTHDLFSYGDSLRKYVFDEVSIIGDNGVEYRVNGQAEDIDGNDFDYLRRVEIAEYLEKSSDAQTDVVISDVIFNYETLNNTVSDLIFDPETGNDNPPSKTLEVNGIVRNTQTDNQNVTITTAAVLNWGFEPFVPFNGSIEMSAEDGSLFYQNANPYVDPENFGALFADFSYTSANGDLTESQQQSYSFPFGFGEVSCFEFRSDLTGRLDCPEIFPR